MVQTESDYGPRNRLLYSMDRGMTLHLAGEYVQSNAQLESAPQEVERLYTKTIRTETSAFLTNDNVLPYEGDPYEHVMINSIKALNYAAMGQLTEAVVEARQIDHRLNVLSDTAKEKDGSREEHSASGLDQCLTEEQMDALVRWAFSAGAEFAEAVSAIGSYGSIPTGAPPTIRDTVEMILETLSLYAANKDSLRLDLHDNVRLIAEAVVNRRKS